MSNPILNAIKIQSKVVIPIVPVVDSLPDQDVILSLILWKYQVHPLP